MHIPFATCTLYRHALQCRRDSGWKHKGLKAFFEAGSKKGIQPKHESRLRLQLTVLDRAKSAQDMNAPGWLLHPLKGKDAGRWSVWVNGNWRVTFEFDGGDAILVDYQDYH